MKSIFDEPFEELKTVDFKRYLPEQRPVYPTYRDTTDSTNESLAKAMIKADEERVNRMERQARELTRIQEANDRQAVKDTKAAERSTADLAKLGLPDTSEQTQHPNNWFEAKRATNYDNMPYKEQLRIREEWLDQAQVRLISNDPERIKAAKAGKDTTRADLEGRIGPAPVQPKAGLFDTDIIDKMRAGGNSMLAGANKALASFTSDPVAKADRLASAQQYDAAASAIRQNEFNPETIDAQRTTALQRQNLVAEYGGEENIPFTKGLAQDVRDFTTGGIAQTVGNIGQSAASMAPQVAGNLMSIGGAALTATGAGAVVGVPLALAGRAVATLGGAGATAGDVGGEAYDELSKVPLDKMRLTPEFQAAKATGISDEAARLKTIDSLVQKASLGGAALGALEGFIGVKLGAGSAAKGLAAGARKLGTEIATDAASEGAGQVVVNAAANAGGDNRSLTQGVRSAAVQGALAGGGMSLGTQALGAVLPGETAPAAGPAPANTAANLIAAGATNTPAPTGNAAQTTQSAVAMAQANLTAAQATGDATAIEQAAIAVEAAQARAGATNNVAAQATDTQATVEAPTATVEAPAATVEAPTATVETPAATVEAPTATVETPAGISPSAAVGKYVNYQGIQGTLIERTDGLYVQPFQGDAVLVESALSGKTTAELGIEVMAQPNIKVPTAPRIKPPAADATPEQIQVYNDEALQAGEAIRTEGLNIRQRNQAEAKQLAAFDDAINILGLEHGDDGAGFILSQIEAKLQLQSGELTFEQRENIIQEIENAINTNYQPFSAARTTKRSSLNAEGTAPAVAKGGRRQKAPDSLNALAPEGLVHLGKAPTSGNFATSTSQITRGLPEMMPGVYSLKGTPIDPQDSLAVLAQRPEVQARLKELGFNGFKTEAGETFALGQRTFSTHASEKLAAISTDAKYAQDIHRAVITPSDKVERIRVNTVQRFLRNEHPERIMDVMSLTGAGITVQGSLAASSPWAESVRDGSGLLLSDLAAGAKDVGFGVAEQAQAVLRMYLEAGIPMPKVQYQPGSFIAGTQRTLAQYQPKAHTVVFSDGSAPSTVIHEYLHGITQAGFYKLKDTVDGRRMTALMDHIRKLVAAQAKYMGIQGEVYATTSNAELLSEMFSPEFLHVAAQTTLTNPTHLGAKALLAELRAKPGANLLDVISAIIKRVIEALGIRTVPNSVADIMAALAAQQVEYSKQGVQDGVLNEDGSFRKYGQDADPAPLNAQAPALLPPNTVSTNAVSMGQTGRVASAQMIDNITAGRNVQPLLKVSSANAIKRAAMGGDYTPAKAGAKKTAEKIGDAFHDSMGPATRFIRSLPISDAARERLVGLLSTAPNKRDTLLSESMKNHGGEAALKLVAEIQQSTKINGVKISVETASAWVGHWITASNVEEVNASLLQNKADEHTAALAALRQNPADPKLQKHEQEALAAYRAQEAAIDSQDLNAGGDQGTPHAAGVGGGMNNAQSRALRAAVEKHIPVEKLKAVAAEIYKLNSWRLALDVERGKADPATVAGFLKRPTIQPLLEQLQQAYRDGNVTEALRQEVRDAVRTEYVPMTGHPGATTDGADDGVFGRGSAMPNAAADYKREGRTSGIADDGIATTMASLVRSATFAGFGDFTSGIAQVHDLMSEEQRKAYGIEKIEINSTVRGGDNVLLDGRENNKVGYTIADEKVLEAIRFNNVETANNLISQTLGRGTKAFQYLVTQANPIFAPKNWWADMIERGALLSTRTYYNEQGKPVTVSAASFLGQQADAFGAVRRHVNEKQDYSNPADVALRELIEQGGLSTQRDLFARTSRDLAKQINNLNGSVGHKTLEGLKEAISNWNQRFDMVAPLASYLAIKAQGVTSQDAAAGALDLMNFRKKGAHMSAITAGLAFAQPAVTGGANLISMLKTPKGKKIFAAYLVAAVALQLAAGATGDEDEGGNVLDQLPDYARNNNINLQWGDYIVSVPVGFGASRLANTSVRAVRDMSIKDKKAWETTLEILFAGVMPSFTPLEDYNIKDPLKKSAMALTPTIFKPGVAEVMNVTTQGRVINQEKWIDKNKYRHLQGSKTIEPFYRSTAEVVFAVSGGQLDLTPESVKQLAQGYALGPGRILLNELVTNPGKEEKGKATGLPVVGSILSPVAKPLNDTAWKGQIAEAQEAMDGMRKEENAMKGVASKKPDLLALQRTKEYKLMEQYDEMDQELRNKSAAATRAKNKNQITEKGADARKAKIRDEREKFEAKWLVKWRAAKGL